ncbi:MAG: hypothetical protein JWN76_2166 [Chitinophagaceae bacterium]|nr:hypothetical protein [Chitinophagaceae bacterium]
MNFSIKRRFLILSFALSCLFLSCHRPGKTVIVQNGHFKLKVEYAGTITYKPDGTGIEKISPDGYVHYRKNEIKVLIKPGWNSVRYELYKSGDKYPLNNIGKKILADALKEIISYGQ